jgi:energy-coupling factor transporter ATP-binding protein EcfA2
MDNDQIITIRRLDNWLTSYIKYTRHSEASTSFHVWSALTTLAAAVNRNIWMDWGYYKSYPNLYVLFVGPSGVGKSTSSGIAIQLLRDAQLRVPIYKDFITPQGLVQFMSESKVSVECNGKISYKTPCLVYASELGTLLTRTAGIQELTLVLTELFNKQGNYEYRTKGSGFIYVENPNVTFWACCFPQWIDEELSSAALRSGFLGRMLVVNNTKRRFWKEGMTLSVDDQMLREDLIHDLQIISSLYGEIKWRPEAKVKWSKWYINQETEYTQGTDNIEVEGFISRRAQFIQRVAMLLAVAQRNELEIDIADFDLAFDLIRDCEHATRGIGQTTVYFTNIQKLKKNLIGLSKLRGDLKLKLRDIMTRVSKFMRKVELEESLEQLVMEGFCKYDKQEVVLFPDLIETFEEDSSPYKKKKKKESKDAIS